MVLAIVATATATATAAALIATAVWVTVVVIRVAIERLLLLADVVAVGVGVVLFVAVERIGLVGRGLTITEPGSVILPDLLYLKSLKRAWGLTPGFLMGCCDFVN